MEFFLQEIQPAIVKKNCGEGESCINIHRELISVCEGNTIHYSNVNRWME